MGNSVTTGNLTLSGVNVIPPGRELRPLKSSAFSWRTISPTQDTASTLVLFNGHDSPSIIDVGESP